MTASGDHSETKFSRRLEFTEDANLDLRSIVRYTNSTWGPEQRDRYVDRITRSFQDLLLHPLRGSAQDDVTPGLRRLHVGQHIIYYRVLDDSIRIVRILASEDGSDQASSVRTKAS